MSSYRVVPGAAHSPVVLHVPHGSRRVPADARAAILLNDAALALELDRMTDTDTGLIAARAAELGAARAVGPTDGAAWIFENLTSRLVVDPERFPDEREEMRAVGMGAVYTRTSHREPLRLETALPGGSAEDARLIDAYFTPYAQAMTDLVDERLAATGRCVIIDVHSYPSVALPYELHADGVRPAVCLGTDAFHTPDWLLDAAQAAFQPVGDVALNTPFAGCYVPLRHYGVNPAVSALMIELRRDVYVVEPAGPPHAGLPRLAGALARLVAQCPIGGTLDGPAPADPAGPAAHPGRGAVTTTSMPDGGETHPDGRPRPRSERP